MKSAVLLGCCLLVLGVCADVKDEALIWRQGADEIDPASAFARVEEDVISPWNGHTNRMSVLRLNQTVAESLKFPVSSLITTNIANMTLHVRCRWDGTFLPGTKYLRAYLISYGNSWGEYRGSSFSFIPLDNGLSSVRFDNGRTQSPLTSPTVETNVWYDAFFTIQDPNANSTTSHNVYIHCYLFKDGLTWTDVNRTSQTDSWRSSSGNYRSAEMKPTDSIEFGSQFSGSIARVGFWDRALSTSEMASVSARPHTDGRLVYVKGGELSAEVPALEIPFYENGHGIYDKTFDAYSYRNTMPQVLTIKALPDSESCVIEAVLDEGTPKERVIMLPSLNPGRAVQAWVSALSRGDHVLTLRRKRGSARLDFVELGGSWSVGDYCYSIVNNWKQYTGNLSPYVIGTDTPKSLSGGVSKEGLLEGGQNLTLDFTLTSEMTRPAYWFDIATGQARDSKRPFLVVYVNGVEFTRSSAPYQYGNVRVTFPPNTFRAGSNRIALRFDASQHPDNYWAVIRGLRMIVQKEGLPKNGMSLFVR